jgi:hypothetical protein
MFCHRLTLVLVLGMAACSDHTLQQTDPAPGQQSESAARVNPRRQLDILFMVDNSPSMEQEQTNLAKNFSAMMEGLKSMGLPDLHIAVVDSDLGAGNIVCNSSLPLGDRGLMWGNPGADDPNPSQANVNLRMPAPAVPGCGLQAGARWIEHNQDNKHKNYTGDIADVFGCLAQVGTKGCGYEHQLQAVRAALSAGTNTTATRAAAHATTDGWLPAPGQGAG